MTGRRKPRLAEVFVPPVAATARRTALWAALAYLAPAVLWVLFTDTAVDRLIAPAYAPWAQTLKGLAFVTGSALVVFWLVLWIGMARLRASEQLAARERQMGVLLANLPGMAYRCAPRAPWRMAFVSDGCEPLTGYTPDDLMGEGESGYLALIHPDDRSRVVAEVDQAIAADRPFRLDYRIITANGEGKWVWEHGRRINDADGRPIAIEGFITDMTDRRRTEQIAQERDRFRDTTRAMEQVLGVIGHELRTPLAALQAVSELLLTDDVDEEQTRDLVRSMHEETGRMTTMVNHMLDTARYTGGTARWCWANVNIAETCREAVEVLSPLIDADRVKLLHDVSPPDLKLRGDADALRRLILNLATNALRHTREGWVCLAARAARHGSNRWIELVVSDTGEGMAEGVLDKLGQALALHAEASPHRRLGGGTGLGLAICRQIVAAHGGSITVESTPGRGTTFKVLLRGDLDEPVTAGDAAVIRREGAA